MARDGDRASANLLYGENFHAASTALITELHADDWHRCR